MVLWYELDIVQGQFNSGKVITQVKSVTPFIPLEVGHVFHFGTNVFKIQEVHHIFLPGPNADTAVQRVVILV
jgi:hypothetical protein